jgi:hypothetical protein
MRPARAERLLFCLALAAAGACALAPGLASCAPPELGTLFHTPEERERLDRLRRGEPPVEKTSGVSGSNEVTGFVKRSDGRSTVWIDGVPMQLSSPRAGVLLEPKVVRGYSDPRDTLRIERSKAK